MLSWDEYKSKFHSLSIDLGYSDSYIISCLEYAKKIYFQKLPIIYDEKHFSLLVGYKIYYLYAISNKPHKFYTTFSLPKKNGSLREINAPYPSLLEIQRWILDNILYKIPTSRYAKAFQKASDIIINARFHRKQEKVLRIDIKDFFTSIKANSVYYIFRKCGYTNKLANLFTRLCTLNGCLPQGAATSPALSNIFFKQLDNRIGGYAIKNQIRYTRYADDMFFSGCFNPGKIIHMIKFILSEYHLSINTDKTKLMTNGAQQRVTGIVTNSILNAPRSEKRRLLQIAYYINKYGLESHLNRNNIVECNYIKKLMGKTYFIRHINHNTPKIDWIISVFKRYL